MNIFVAPPPRTTAVDDLMGGYTRDQLEASFNIVKNKEHWKLPIDCTLPKDTPKGALKQLDFAITFFTGSVATFTQEKGKIRVRAAGYYAVIGA